jgi:pimeloyl-ACP methyl ester carboxylesterase
MLVVSDPRSLNRSALAVSMCVSLLFFGIRVAESVPSASGSTQMIERAGHKIAFHVTAGHSPVIVLDAGGGLDSTYWNSLVSTLSARTGSEIISYDRPGFGRSDEVNGPWSLRSATDDLEFGLKRLGATHGVILVAHSLAGEIATSLARRHPAWIAGAILVDANVPEFFTDQQIARQEAIFAPVIAKMKAEPSTQETRQLLAVAQSFSETSRSFHHMSWPDAIPADVILSEKTPFDDPVDADAWRRAHAQFAARANNRKLTIADKSSHDVAHDRPDVIVTAISAMIDSVRQP